MNKREQQRQQTRATILSAAERIYASNGFVQSSTQLIAKEAGVAHGTVFLHFQSQEKLILAVINVLGTDITTRIHESSEQSHSLADVLWSHLTAIETHESIYSHLIMDMPQLPKEAQQTVIGIQSIIAHHFDQVLNLKDLPISFIFNTWIGLIHYYLTNRRLFAPHGSVLAIYKDELILNFLKLLEVDES